MPRIRDAVTNGLFTLDGEQSKAFAGKLWSAHYSASIASGSAMNLLLVQTANNVAVPTILVHSGQLVTATLYEGTTASNDGTTITVYNRNRAVTASPLSVLTHTPTVTGGQEGTALLSSLQIPALSPGYVTLISGWVFKASTKYLLRISNASGSNSTISVYTSWYET